MERTDAEILELTYDLMKKHGLTKAGWTPAVVCTPHYLGRCYYERRIIEISSAWHSKNSLDDLIDTILHEIAHAIAGYEAAHGAKWKFVAQKIGCSAKVRCDTSGMELPEPTVVGMCLCGYIHRRYSKHVPGGFKYVCNQCKAFVKWRKK